MMGHCQVLRLTGNWQHTGKHPSRNGCACAGWQAEVHFPGPPSGAPYVWLSETVPHDVLFPLCSLIVHHGGAGTTHAALAAGMLPCALPSRLGARRARMEPQLSVELRLASYVTDRPRLPTVDVTSATCTSSCHVFLSVARLGLEPSRVFLRHGLAA